MVQYEEINENVATSSRVRRLIWPRSASYVRVPVSARDHDGRQIREANSRLSSSSRSHRHHHGSARLPPGCRDVRARSNKCYQLCLRSALNRAKDAVPRGGNCPEAIQPPHSSADRATSHEPSTSARVCRANANSRSVRDLYIGIVELSSLPRPAITGERELVFSLETRERGLRRYHHRANRYFRQVPRGGKREL